MQNDIIGLVTNCVRKVSAAGVTALDVRPNAALSGANGILDSVELVTLVVAVEEGLRHTYGVEVDLIDGYAMSHERSPLRTIESLAQYARQALMDGI